MWMLHFTTQRPKQNWTRNSFSLKIREISKFLQDFEERRERMSYESRLQKQLAAITARILALNDGEDLFHLL